MATRRSLGYVSRTTPIVRFEYGVETTGGIGSEAGEGEDCTVPYRTGMIRETRGRSFLRSFHFRVGL